MSDEQIIECIKSQNKFIMEGELKVLKVYENKIFQNYGAILETDGVSFKKIMNKNH